jgi:hypothetical protein
MRQPGRVTLSGEALLALLADVEIDFTSDIATARTIYAAALPAGSSEPTLDSLIEEGWIRVLWGRITGSSLGKRANNSYANSRSSLSIIKVAATEGLL